MSRRKGDGIDTCTSCGSDELWGTEGTEEHPDEWVLVCNNCGKVQGKRSKSQQRADA